MPDRRATIGLLAVAVLGVFSACGERTSPPEMPAVASYVGRPACAECHAPEAERWQGSHHDRAMQVANASTVLGDFGGVSYTHFGVTSVFTRRGDRFYVRTDGPDGRLADYEIRYTFGFDPLQQYLVELPGGRLQVLGLCWDTRSAEQGGQRWFHLYPDEAIPHGDALHWTRPSQNWNHACAECHSTDLRKAYRADEDRFETEYSEIDVSCEACHGPGSRHVAWARDARAAPLRDREAPATAAEMGLALDLGQRQGVRWELDSETGTARRSVPRRSHVEVEMCARCHSRRSAIHLGYLHGRPLLDTHRLAILDEGVYHPDGQILEEVYVYGSFLQSRMYRAGVTCSDCHDAHTGRLHAEGNALCARCHDAGRFDAPGHHFHPADSAGALCVECHMPARTYMVVDPRHDHSLRVPRPDLSMKLGTPNACVGCHRDRSNPWAADAVATWYGADRRSEPHWGEAIQAGREGSEGAGEQLIRLLGDATAPGIARATAISLFPRSASPGDRAAYETALGDRDPLVRVAALAAIESLPPEARLPLAGDLLDDPLRAVRLEAARVLAPVPARWLSPERRIRLDAVLDDYRATQLRDADRPDAQLRLAALDLQRGDVPRARQALETALRLDPTFVPAYVNLADLHRIRGRDDEGERVLRRALEGTPESADLHHALGLLLVRLGQREQAIAEIELAARLRPDVARYSYVLAVALHSSGEVERALEILRAARARHPGDREIRSFLEQLEPGR